MTRTHRFLGVLSASLIAACLALVAPAHAAGPDTTRGRPLDPRPSTGRLAMDLHRLEWRSHGAIDVRAIGQSNQGRPVWGARVGHGPLRILYVTDRKSVV